MLKTLLVGLLLVTSAFAQIGGIYPSGGAPLASPAFTGTPTAPTATSTDNSTTLATTAYVTTGILNAINAAAGRDLVKAATAAVLPNTPTFTSVASGIGSFFTSSTNSVLVVDGYTPVLNDRILVKNQATSANNGIYKVTQLGVNAVLPWIMTRALDYDVPSDMNNTIVPVANNGTVNPLTSWIMTSTVATVDTDAVTFAAFTPSGANIVTAVAPGVGLCHFAGSTQVCTSSLIVNADITNATIDLPTKVAGILPTANIAVALANQTSLRGNAMAAAAGDATIGQVIAHGAKALDFASTATGACATVITDTATGAASTDVILFTTNASIKAVTGYVPASTGGFSINAYPTTNTVNFEACNWTSGTVDPGSITVNWVVVR